MKYTGRFLDTRGTRDTSSFYGGDSITLTPYTATKFKEDTGVKKDWSVVREYMAGKVLDPASLDLMSEDADVLESFRDSESRFENKKSLPGSRSSQRGRFEQRSYTKVSDILTSVVFSCCGNGCDDLVIFFAYANLGKSYND